MIVINLPISCAEVCWCIFDFEPANSEEIARKTGLTKSTVQVHLSTLEKNGAVKVQDRPKQYCVSDDVTLENLEWLKEFEALARATKDFRVKTLPLLPGTGSSKSNFWLMIVCARKRSKYTYFNYAAIV